MVVGALVAFINPTGGRGEMGDVNKGGRNVVEPSSTVGVKGGGVAGILTWEGVEGAKKVEEGERGGS